MRIAHVSDCYAPRTGGIETQVRSLAVQQALAGDDVRVITATGGDGEVFAGVDERDGIPIHRVAARIPFGLPVHPRTRREVGAILRRDPVDVVHVHSGVISPFAWGAVRAAVEVGIPTLVTVHSVWGPLARPGYGLSDALGHWSRWGVTLSSVSEVAARQIERAVPGAGQVLVVPNGIDPAAWRVDRTPAGEGPLRAVSVMRLAPRKRVIPLLRVVQEASQRCDVQLTVIGDGPERHRAQSYARRHRIPALFVGRLERDAIKDVFSVSDVFIQPSVKESFGIAALEARCAGLTVLARAEAGTTQFVRQGIEGLIAPDDTGMASALVRLSQDRDLLERICSHNIQVPADQSWPRVLDIVHTAYERAIGVMGAPR